MRKNRSLTALALIVVLISALILSGCTGKPDKQAAETGISKKDAERYTFLSESQTTEENQRKQLAASPTPTFDSSVQRNALNERLNRLNVESKIGYLYLISYGRVMAFYTIKGAPYSVNSMLTNPQQVIAKRGWGDEARADEFTGVWAYTDLQQFVVDSPDLDGTYGPDGPPDAIFWFNTDGTYGEWKGEYHYTDKPMQLTSQPELVRTVK